MKGKNYEKSIYYDRADFHHRGGWNSSGGGGASNQSK